jgi:hypothetical protein
MTVMRDIQLVKANVKGERATYKIQDFTDDPVLFTFCNLPQVCNTARAQEHTSGRSRRL